MLWKVTVASAENPCLTTEIRRVGKPLVRRSKSCCCGGAAPVPPLWAVAAGYGKSL